MKTPPYLAKINILNYLAQLSSLIDSALLLQAPDATLDLSS